MCCFGLGPSLCPPYPPTPPDCTHLQIRNSTNPTRKKKPRDMNRVPSPIRELYMGRNREENTKKSQTLSFVGIGPRTNSDRFVCVLTCSSASIADRKEAGYTCFLPFPGPMPSDGYDDDGPVSAVGVVFFWCLVPGSLVLNTAGSTKSFRKYPPF